MLCTVLLTRSCTVSTGSRAIPLCQSRGAFTESTVSTVSIGRTLFRLEKHSIWVCNTTHRDALQSAFAKFVLNKQLSAVALLSPSLESQNAMDVVFNDGASIKCGN